METDRVDLAKGTFIEYWPHWVRWLLFIPASILVPLVWVLFQFIMNTWFLDLGSNAFYFNFIRGIAYGAGIVIIGSVVAPKGQRVVALLFLVLIAMVIGIALLSELQHFVLNGFLEEIIMLAAAVGATYYIFNETK